MRTAIAVALLVVLAVPAHAQIYEWTDAEGRRHFTDDLNRVPPEHRPAASAGAWPTPRPSAPPPGEASSPGSREALLREAVAACAPRFPALRARDEGARAGVPSGPDGARVRAAFERCVREALRERLFARLPLCHPDAVAVTSRWDAALERVHDALLVGVGPDLQGRRTRVVVVDGPRAMPIGATCGDARESTIFVSIHALRHVQQLGDPEWAIARIVAHELAHAVLHADLRRAAGDEATVEYEADELGMYYFQQAGYDCRTWVNSIGLVLVAAYDTPDNQRHVLRAACAQARQGVRPERRLPGGEPAAAAPRP
jgi:hypothetical protein